MGKAIDAIHNAMAKIKNDGSKFLDEDFMNQMFSRIGFDSNGDEAPLEPLVDAMVYQFEEKKTSAMDGSKVLPFDQLNAELFYSERQENKDTTRFVEKFVVEVVQCFLQELSDPKRQLLTTCLVPKVNSAGEKYWRRNTRQVLV